MSSQNIISNNNLNEINDDVDSAYQKNFNFIKKIDTESIQYRALKIWVIAVIIITIIYALYWYFYYEYHPVAYYDIRRQNYLRQHTPSYPPPLTSFMDPPDVFDDKYVKLITKCD